MSLHGPRTPPFEEGLHPDVDEDGLDSGGDDGAQSRPGIARTPAKDPHETEREPEQPEVAERGGGVEDTVRGPVAAQRGEDLLDPGIESLTNGRIKPTGSSVRCLQLPTPPHRIVMTGRGNGRIAQSRGGQRGVTSEGGAVALEGAEAAEARRVGPEVVFLAGPFDGRPHAEGPLAACPASPGPMVPPR